MDIQELHRQIDSFDITDKDLKSVNWSQWAKLPTSKIFLDYLFTSRHQIMLQEFESVSHFSSQKSSENQFHRSLGMFTILGQIISMITDLVKEEEKEGLK